MVEVSSLEDFYTRIRQNGLTIAKFSADWCPDCRRIDPFMPDVVQKYLDQADWIAVDRDQYLELCELYDVYGIPSFIAFRDGKEVARFVSKLGKSREEIERFVEQAIAAQ